MIDSQGLRLHQETLHVETPGRGFVLLDRRIDDELSKTGFRRGLAMLFCRHTSCSVLIQENADPRVQADFEAWFQRIAPDGDPRYTHREEGPDDMPAHLRSAMTHTSLHIPVVDGRLALGTWQSVYLVEHRVRPHQRQVIVQLLGR